MTIFQKLHDFVRRLRTPQARDSGILREALLDEFQAFAEEYFPAERDIFPEMPGSTPAAEAAAREAAGLGQTPPPLAHPIPIEDLPISGIPPRAQPATEVPPTQEEIDREAVSRETLGENLTPAERH